MGCRPPHWLWNSKCRIVKQLNLVRGPFNTTSIAQQIARIALNDEAFIQSTKVKNLEVKLAFQQFLDDIGWHHFPSKTNLCSWQHLKAEQICLII